jgi:hypothetical protein
MPHVLLPVGSLPDNAMEYPDDFKETITIEAAGLFFCDPTFY